MGKSEIDITEYFHRLGLSDWKIQGNKNGGGQAATIEVRNQRTGENGVLRILKSTLETDINRFYRELEILSKTDHPNVVKILASTQDTQNQWYISKRGVSFHDHWKSYFKSQIGEPDEVLAAALKILHGLTNGLIDLHDKGVVHRDIKSNNVVLDGATPVLIDFGVAYVLGEDRLTAVSEAVANVFSPDPALSFMYEVPAWIDVFLLSQLLIWMVSNGNNKPSKPRPLDWRWVVYPPFAELDVQKIQALTAICSSSVTCPRNAADFKKLLTNLFSIESLTMRNENANLDDLKKVLLGASSNQLIVLTEAREKIEARLPFFKLVCRQLELGIKDMMDDLSESLSVKSLISSGPALIEDFLLVCSQIKQILPTHLAVNRYYRLENHSGEFLPFRVFYNCYTTRGIKESFPFEFLENRPFIQLNIFQDNEHLIMNRLAFVYLIVPTDVGTLELYDVNKKFLKSINVVEVVELIRANLTNINAWRLARG